MSLPPMGGGVNDRRTPPELFEKWDRIYRFTLDGAASHENALCGRYSTPQGTFQRMGRGWYPISYEDGLAYPWHALERVYINPPYGRGLLEPFVRKAHLETVRYGSCVVALLPARTDQEWFHEHVDGASNARITWLRGRVRYDGMRAGAPFPSMIVEWR